MQTSVGQELNDHFHKEPAIMMTGQHHAREIVPIKWSSSLSSK